MCDNCYFCLCNTLCKVIVGNTSMWINMPEGFMEMTALHIPQHVLKLEHGFFVSRCFHSPWIVSEECQLFCIKKIWNCGLAFCRDIKDVIILIYGKMCNYNKPKHVTEHRVVETTKLPTVYSMTQHILYQDVLRFQTTYSSCNMREYNVTYSSKQSTTCYEPIFMN